MAVSDRNSYVRGNTVLIPEYNPSREYNDEKHKKLEKSKKEAQAKLRKQKTKEKLAVLRLIAFVFVIGVFLLYRYALIYKMEASLSSYKAQASNLVAENESLKLKLAKNANISSVEDTAINTLHMINPNPADIIKVDLSKNNFKVDQSNNKSASILDKLKKILLG